MSADAKVVPVFVVCAFIIGAAIGVSSMVIIGRAHEVRLCESLGKVDGYATRWDSDLSACARECGGEWRKTELYGGAPCVSAHESELRCLKRGTLLGRKAKWEKPLAACAERCGGKWRLVDEWKGQPCTE